MPKEQISSNDYSVKKVHRLQILIHIRKLPVLPKYRNLSKIRNSKCQHADTYPFHVPKHIGARSNGSSGSQYVVHQQDMLSGKTFGVAKIKDAVHILPPFIGRFPCLRFRMLLAHHRSSVQRDTRNCRNTFGYTLWLYPRIRCLRGCKGTGTMTSTSQKNSETANSAAIKRPMVSPKSLRPPYFK